jgi:hypothetical protein
MVLLGDGAQMEARFGSFGDCANLDSRYVHSLDASDGTPSDVGHVESHFGPFGDSVRVGAR